MFPELQGEWTQKLHACSPIGQGACGMQSTALIWRTLSILACTWLWDSWLGSYCASETFLGTSTFHLIFPTTLWVTNSICQPANLTVKGLEFLAQGSIIKKEAKPKLESNRLTHFDVLFSKYLFQNDLVPGTVPIKKLGHWEKSAPLQGWALMECPSQTGHAESLGLSPRRNLCPGKIAFILALSSFLGWR